MRVLVTGGTGLVGTRLVQQLLDRGDQPVVLTRRPDAARQSLGSQVELIEGNPTNAETWTEKIDDCDAVIHLAGENLFARRWNAAFKERLRDSRVRSTRNVATALLRHPLRADGQPRVLVSASAVGIYGPRGDEEITEETPPGNDFLAGLCRDWEEAARGVESGGIRAVQVRIGVVLDREGGALAKLLTPFRLFVGGPVGSGRQYMPWIHHQDLVGLFLFALDTPACRGPLNGTAPHPVTNAEFSHALGRTLHRPSFFWTPAFALRLGLGEVANVITTGQRVVPRKALDLGYSFRHPHLDAALADVLGPGARKPAESFVPQSSRRG